jgi:hypothetical protein
MRRGVARRGPGPRTAESGTRVLNRGTPPDSFIKELLAFGNRIKTAAPEIFAPNNVAVDIFTVIKPYLATPMGKDPSGTQLYQWDSLLHRLAALLEAQRVHAGMESSWDWNEGVDITNHTSMTHIEGQETGIFQVSFDSTYLGKGAMKPFAKAKGIDTPERFIRAMKRDHQLALEYYGRLSRVSIRWAGPLLRHGDDSVYPWLNRKAVAEFMKLLS